MLFFPRTLQGNSYTYVISVKIKSEFAIKKKTKVNLTTHSDSIKKLVSYDLVIFLRPFPTVCEMLIIDIIIVTIIIIIRRRTISYIYRPLYNKNYMYIYYIVYA